MVIDGTPSSLGLLEIQYVNLYIYIYIYDERNQEIVNIDDIEENIDVK
jgi:hypothetical protein